MSEKEFIHVEVDPNHKLSVQMCCTPKTLVVMIASMLIEVAKRRGQMSVRKMLDDIIWLTESEEKNEIAGSAFFSAAEKGKIRAAIEKEPEEDVKPVVHAHWIPECPNKRNKKAYRHTCSECGRTVYDARQVSIDEMGYAFCPNCGAKMDEEKQDG